MGKDNTKEKERIEMVKDAIAPLPSWHLNSGEKVILLQIITEINNAVRSRNIAIQSMMAARDLDPMHYMIDIEAGVIRRKETENVVAEKSS